MRAHMFSWMRALTCDYKERASAKVVPSARATRSDARGADRGRRRPLRQADDPREQHRRRRIRALRHDDGRPRRAFRLDVLAAVRLRQPAAPHRWPAGRSSTSPRWPVRTATGGWPRRLRSPGEPPDAAHRLRTPVDERGGELGRPRRHPHRRARERADARMEAAMLRTMALGRLCEPADITDAVLVLVPPPARRISGPVLTMSAGGVPEVDQPAGPSSGVSRAPRRRR